MARKASPWYRAERNEWCVTVDGKHHRLGEHPKGAPPPKKSPRTKQWNAPKEILDAFHQLLTSGEPEPERPDEDAVVCLLDDFITWSKENRAKITALRYEEFCQDFVKAVVDGAKLGSLPPAKLTSRHVTAWLAQRPAWGPTTKRNAITAIQRGFNWAVKNRGLDRNPIKGMDKPEAHRPKSVVTPDEFEGILEHATGPFGDLLTVSYDCGARPFEVKDLERRHVDLDKQQAVIPADEAKGRKHTRVFYFPTDRSMEIVKRLCETYPEGPLFRNRLGNKWTGNAVKCTFARLEKKIGKRVKHYDFRRTFITRKIIAGVDSHVVAKLSGHQSTAMIDKHYSAVANDHEYMLRMAAQDITPKKGS